MTQRRRLSRAQVAATPGREVRPGISARMWWGDGPEGFALSREAMLAEGARPQAQDAALLRREDVERAASRGTLTMEEFEETLRLVMESPPPPPRAIVMSERLRQEFARYGSRDRGDDQADAVALAWWGAVPVRSDVPGGPRAERVRLQAMERTGRVLVAWLIGRWRR